jgi:hypothetical protein
LRRKLEGKAEAYLVALTSSEPPEGRKSNGRCGCWPIGWSRSGWSGDKRRGGQKDAQEGDVKPWARKRWCIPEVDAEEFVWRMEDVLDLYKDPHDPTKPVVCFGEMPYQLVAQKRTPLSPKPGSPQRYDYEYERRGPANLFVVFEPKKGWRHIDVTQRRTARDFAFSDAKVARRALSGCREGKGSYGQPEYSHARFAVRGVRARGSQAHPASARVSPRP